MENRTNSNISHQIPARVIEAKGGVVNSAAAATVARSEARDANQASDPARLIALTRTRVSAENRRVPLKITRRRRCAQRLNDRMDAHQRPLDRVPIERITIQLLIAPTHSALSVAVNSDQFF